MRRPKLKEVETCLRLNSWLTPGTKSGQHLLILVDCFTHHKVLSDQHHWAIHTSPHGWSSSTLTICYWVSSSSGDDRICAFCYKCNFFRHRLIVLLSLLKISRQRKYCSALKHIKRHETQDTKGSGRFKVSFTIIRNNILLFSGSVMSNSLRSHGL